MWRGAWRIACGFWLFPLWRFSPRAAAVDGSDLAQSILARRRRGRAARQALPKGRNFH